MKLSEKELQELKDKKISIEELDDRYFIPFQPLYSGVDNDAYEIEVENISKLLNSNIYSFKEIVDKFKTIRDFRNNLCLYRLLENRKFFKEFFKKDKLTEDDTRYLLNKINKIYELRRLCENTSLLKSITDNGVSFKELIDTFKNIKDDWNNAPCLEVLLENQKFFDELIENNKLTKDDLRYLLNRLNNEYEVYKLRENTFLLMYIVDNDLFKELVDKFKSIKDGEDEPCLYKLLDNKKFFEVLIKNHILNKEDTRYLLNKIDEIYELRRLCENTSLLKYIVDNGVSFKELVDKFKSIIDNVNNSALHMLLENKDLFEELIESKKLNTDDLRDLLNKIDKIYELRDLCKNTSLIKHILNEFVLNTEDVDSFNKIIEKANWCEVKNIHTIFEYIEYKTKHNEELLRLTEANRYIFDLNEEQKVELLRVLKDNEQTKNRLIQIVDNNLEDQYDFESLKNLLTKDGKKSLKTKFNF